MPLGVQYPVPHATYVKDSEHGMIWGNHPDMSDDVRLRLQQVVKSNLQSFAFSLLDLPGYSGKQGGFRIKLRTDKPIFSNKRCYTLLERQVTDEKCTEMETPGLIILAPDDCEFASCPVIPLKKDADGNYTYRRFCVDYRGLNDDTVPDKYQLHPST
jgi:hypothetical protein